MAPWIPDGLTQFERAVLSLLLDRPGELYAALRHQLSFASVEERDLTGVGFFRHFTIPSTASIQRDLPSCDLCDIEADHPQLESGSHTMLCVRDGVASFLECVTCTGDWPEDESAFTLRLHRSSEHQGNAWPSAPEV